MIRIRFKGSSASLARRKPLSQNGSPAGIGGMIRAAGGESRVGARERTSNIQHPTPNTQHPIAPTAPRTCLKASAQHRTSPSTSSGRLRRNIHQATRTMKPPFARTRPTRPGIAKRRRTSNCPHGTASLSPRRHGPLAKPRVATAHRRQLKEPIRDCRPSSRRETEGLKRSFEVLREVRGAAGTNPARQSRNCVGLRSGV
jgi:hypothetical protein